MMTSPSKFTRYLEGVDLNLGCAPALKQFFHDTVIYWDFPNELKKAVTSIFKKDDPTKAKNYRPVNALPVPSNFFEKIMDK